MMRLPSTIPFSIGWLPDGQLLVVAGQRLGGSVVAAGGGDARGGAADRTWWVGTTMTAMAAGVPQLVLPLVSSDLQNAERVDTVGVGAQL